MSDRGRNGLTVDYAADERHQEYLRKRELYPRMIAVLEEMTVATKALALVIERLMDEYEEKEEE